jgi:hypothetical protein
LVARAQCQNGDTKDQDQRERAEGEKNVFHDISSFSI